MKRLFSKKKARSREELESSARELEKAARQDRREQILGQMAQTMKQDPGSVPDSRLDKILARVVRYAEDGGEEDFSELVSAVSEEKERRERQLSREQALARSRERILKDPRKADDGFLDKLERRVARYVRDGGREDFSDLTAAIATERRRREDFTRTYTPISETSTTLLESTSDLLSSGQSSLEKRSEDVELSDIDALLVDLKRERDQLALQKEALQQLLSA